MHTIHSLVLSLAGASLLAGCFFDSMPGGENPPTPPPTPEPLALASSFEATAKLSFQPDGYHRLPDTESILLRLDDAADGSVAAVMASDLDAASGTFARTSAGVSLREPIAVSIAAPDVGIFEAQLTFESMDLVAIDNDGDDSVDAVEGSGSGTYTYVGGDVEYNEPFTVELVGSLDRTSPDLFLAATDRIHVLDGIELIATEPLRAGTEVQARVGSTTIDLTAVPADAPYVTSFVTRKILPFDTEVVLAIDPTPKDLAGFEATLGLERIQTMVDPGFFAEDGFEGELAAVASGVEVVTGIGTLPAIGGTRSLLIQESSRLTIRVPVQEGDTHLRLTGRVLLDRVDGLPTLQNAARVGAQSTACAIAQSGMRVGFPALDMVQTIYTTWSSEGADEATGDERWPGARPVATVEVALPEGVGSEVIFDIFPEAPGPGPFCPETALLIDDLRAE